jgi:hypothetical protein
LQALLDLIYSGSLGKLLTLETLDFFASMRFVSVYVGFASVGRSVVGLGMASAFSRYADVSRSFGIEPLSIMHLRRFNVENIKPASYFSQLGLDMGFVGVLLCIPVLMYLLRRFRAMSRRSSESAVYAMALLGLFQLLFMSTTTIPAPWLCLTLIAGWRARELSWEPTFAASDTHAPSEETT